MDQDKILENYTEKQKNLICEKMLEISEDGFVIMDTDNNIAYINPAYCNHLQVEMKDAIGKPILDIILNSKLPEIIHNKEFIEKEVFHLAAKGQPNIHDKYFIVTRASVIEEDKAIAAIGQVKFEKNTMKLAQSLRDLNEELKYYKDEFHRLVKDRFSLDSIKGNSHEMIEIKKIAQKAAENDFTVLLTGETGTGKEVFANAIHYSSKRKFKPLVRVNCAAIPQELFESEFFGYSDGAFTGAKKGGKKGKFELANGGTLFLDEIGDMPLFMQVKLLRVLQEKEIEKIGSEKTIPIDIRVIAATNKNLQEEISKNRFREDLYYRLNVIGIGLPPLRKRKEDIPLFIDSFLEEINEKYNTNIKISKEVKDILMNYTWPGNVRELKNTIERCYTMADNNLITNASLPVNILTKSKLQNYDSSKTLNEIMANIEKEIILQVIEKNNSNIQKTAIDLGVHRSTLYKKMGDYNIKRSDIDIIKE
ncbi:transcriptional regulatory protein ZraR [Clostridium homopropionicum DSM 5847]|uniref:Transcriptional regulatory protein ZraR n=1 Tax=Clostridium homopropionicum DSM 5847 TaxID=1121318 RepID=A0A0L6Z638_9CLOT|nr:sigma-54-dependent Fis family transcriptional regulator [Clostridium homopropionicum]KOA18263.1 transcriptional regulatory protein ZraR [Clostridium homopropionicum DSM 5847]SFF70226.1 Transcriptional regulator containing PAS, AAA-type ATPase, and DNA-binding Fis domains [Clostridium homopropionicum]